MKSQVATLFASAALLAFSASSVSAQILASYPLSNDLLDATGTNGPVFLYGSTTGPANGVCVGGTWGVPGSGDELYTPTIAGFDEFDFRLDVDFNVTALNSSSSNPILVGSRGWRFIGIGIDGNGNVGILHNNSNWLFSTTAINVGEWHWATLKYDNGNVELLLNGASILTANVGPLSTNNDYRFTTSNWANGGVLDGCVRNIVIANDATIGASTARAADYGTGCGGLTLTANGLPSLGNVTFAYDVEGPLPLLPFAYIGFGNTTIEPGVDLTPVGMPGCLAYTDLGAGITGPATLSATTGAGSLPFPIPNTAALAGALLSAQAIGFLPTQLASSNGTRIYVGN